MAAHTPAMALRGDIAAVESALAKLAGASAAKRERGVGQNGAEGGAAAVSGADPTRRPGGLVVG